MLVSEDTYHRILQKNEHNQLREDLCFRFIGYPLNTTLTKCLSNSEFLLAFSGISLGFFGMLNDIHGNIRADLTRSDPGFDIDSELDGGA